MNTIRRITKSLAALVLTALAFAPVPASAEKISKHTDSEGWEEWYWEKEVTVERGKAHTFWIKDLTETTEITSLDVSCEYTYEEDGETYDDWVSASESTEVENSKGGFDKYVLLTAEDWDWVHESKSKLKFKVRVDGWGEDAAEDDITFTYGDSDGDGDYPGEEPEPVETAPLGAEGNPVTFTIAEANTVQNPGTKNWEKPSNWDTSSFVDGNVYLKVQSMTAGRKYVFGFKELDGATVSMLDADGNELFSIENESDLFSDCTDYCWAVVPPKTGAYTIVVDDDDAGFTCKYAVFASRKPAEHEGVDYGDDDQYADDHFGTLTVGGEAVTFVPNYLNHPKSGANDDVIDGKLFVLSGLAKGANYVFETQDACAPLMMRLYDASGTVLAENLYVNDGDYNVRIVWTAPANLAANAKYYVGVCEKLEDGFEPLGEAVSLTATAVEVEEVSEDLETVPTTGDGNPFEATGAQPSEEHALSATSWTHTYLIAARKDVEYHVKARLAENGFDNGLTLAARVYTLSGTKESALETDGDIDPNGESDYLSFTPTANGTVYVEVSVADGEWGDGKGLDYGPYEVCAVASGDYGILKVEMTGATESLMGWKILKLNGKTVSGEVFYPAGVSAILPAGSYTLLAKTVTGFATPDKNGFGPYEVGAGETTTATYKYADKFDHKDDYPAGKSGTLTYGATSITPKAAGVENVRSLYADDPADWFSFSATAGAYYKFALSEKTGAPEVRAYAVKAGVKKVSSESDLEEITDYVFFADPTESIQFAAEEKGTCYVKVAHQAGSESVDSAYTLVASSANPGVVKFAKTAVSVKDSAGYVDLSVSRSGKEGVTRVDYTTAGDQTSATDALYYPTTGTLVWEDGDNKAKTIRVRIVPQSYGKGGTFQVRLSPAEIEEADRESEFPAIISTETATVTVTAAAKAAPGTIQLADCDTPKKPVVNVTAGEQVWLQLERVSGSDGLVGVTCEPVKGKALPGVDYTAFSAVVLEWNDAESGTNAIPIPIQTWTNETDYTAVKTFTVKLTAKTGKSYAKPTLAASTITINIQNDKFATTAAAYATALKKTTPSIAIKESKSGTWYVRDDGSMFAKTGTAGTLTFTLTGPGVFKYSVDGEEREPLTVAYGQKKGNTVVIYAGETLDWYEWLPMEDALTLRQCVKYSRVFTNGITKVSSGKLPDGLKFAQDKATKKYVLSGTPTKAGYYQVIFTDGAKKPLVAETNNYNVVAAGTAIGTFSGLATTFDTDDGLRSLASVTLSATAAGKLTGKVLVGGKTYSFADTGYASFEDEGDCTTVKAELPYIQKIGAGKTAETVTNWLFCTVVDASETNAVARNAEIACEIAFAKLVDSTGKAYDADVSYEGTLCRDNSKVTDWVTEASKYAGYYTVSLVNDYANAGEPRGNGYLTLTFDAKGKVKIAGLLADGTSYSASSVSAALVERYGATAIRIPLYACKSTYVFGGWLELVPGEDGALLVSSDSKLAWANDAATSTREGEEGFKLELAPVGGWYDTVTNLQKWFLEYDFSVDLPTWADDSENDLLALLPSGYDPIAFAANPCGQAVDVYGDTVSVVKQSLVKDSVTKLNDFENSVNASNVKFTFKRATGVLNGTFDLWYEGYNTKTKKIEQKAVTGLKHNGVLLLSRGDDGLLEDDVWTSGFYLVPQTLSYTDAQGRAATRKWTGSYRFDVKATYVGRDWSATPSDK